MISYQEKKKQVLFGWRLLQYSKPGKRTITELPFHNYRRPDEQPQLIFARQIGIFVSSCASSASVAWAFESFVGETR